MSARSCCSLSAPRVTAGAAARLAWLVGQDILAADEDLCDIGIDGDGIAWLTIARASRSRCLESVSRGAAAGLPVLLTTTSARAAAGLAGLVNALATTGCPTRAAPITSPATLVSG